MNLTTRIESIARADRYARAGERHLKKGRIDLAIRRFGRAATACESADLGGLAKTYWLRLAELCDSVGDVERAAAGREIAAKIEVYDPEEADQ